MISGPELQRLIEAMPHQREGDSDADYLTRYGEFYGSFAYRPPNATKIPTVKTTTVHTNKAA